MRCGGYEVRRWGDENAVMGRSLASRILTRGTLTRCLKNGIVFCNVPFRYLDMDPKNEKF